MLTVLILSLILLSLAFAGIGIKMIFDKKSEFKGIGCNATSPELKKQGVGCGCGSSSCQTGK